LCSTPEQSFTQTRIVPEVRSFEAVEDMISVDLFQDRIKARFRNPHQIICYYKQEVFLSRIYWVKFLCRFLSVSSVPVSTNTEFISYKVIRSTRTTTIFPPSRSRLDFKRKILQQEFHNDGDR
jgi:hypothetical protein